jgi:hypothetical protein
MRKTYPGERGMDFAKDRLREEQLDCNRGGKTSDSARGFLGE